LAFINVLKTNKKLNPWSGRRQVSGTGAGKTGFEPAVESHPESLRRKGEWADGANDAGIIPVTRPAVPENRRDGGETGHWGSGRARFTGFRLSQESPIHGLAPAEEKYLCPRRYPPADAIAVCRTKTECFRISAPTVIEAWRPGHPGPRVHRLPELRETRMLLSEREQSKKDSVNVEHNRLGPRRITYDSPRGRHMRSEEQPSTNNLSSVMEKRRCKRFRIRDNIYLTFCSGLYRLGRIMDISKTGISFEYLALEEHCRVDRVEIDIFSNSRGLYISRILCRVVYDIRCNDYQSLIGLENRRCGLEFARLSEEQMSGLMPVINEFR